MDEGKGFGANEVKISILENELTVYKVKTNKELNSNEQKIVDAEFFHLHAFSYVFSKNNVVKECVGSMYCFDY